LKHTIVSDRGSFRRRERRERRPANVVSPTPSATEAIDIAPESGLALPLFARLDPVAANHLWTADRGDERVGAVSTAKRIAAAGALIEERPCRGVYPRRAAPGRPEPKARSTR